MCRYIHSIFICINTAQERGDRLRLLYNIYIYTNTIMAAKLFEKSIKERNAKCLNPPPPWTPFISNLTLLVETAALSALLRFFYAIQWTRTPKREGVLCRFRVNEWFNQPFVHNRLPGLSCLFSPSEDHPQCMCAGLCVFHWWPGMH